MPKRQTLNFNQNLLGALLARIGFFGGGIGMLCYDYMSNPKGRTSAIIQASILLDII